MSKRQKSSPRPNRSNGPPPSRGQRAGSRDVRARSSQSGSVGKTGWDPLQGDDAHEDDRGAVNSGAGRGGKRQGGQSEHSQRRFESRKPRRDDRQPQRGQTPRKAGEEIDGQTGEQPPAQSTQFESSEGGNASASDTAASRSDRTQSADAARSFRKPKRSFGPRAQSREPDDFCALFGLHAVAAALANPARQHRQLFVTENAAQRLDLEAYTADLEIVSVTPRDLDRRLGTDTVHQGVLLETSHTPTASLPELISSSATGPIIVLDQVTDPHNVGAVLRSAAVFDARGVILTKRNSPPLSGVLAKAASGGLEATRVHLASNLARAIKSLQEAGVNVVGLASDADGQLQQVNTQRPTAFVLGAEGKGLRKLTAEACDQLVLIETGATITSLNVSNAAAIVLHWTSMQHAS